MDTMHSRNNLIAKIAKFFMKLLTIISPTLSSKLIYRINLKKKLNLKNPTLFDEKLMYLKLKEYRNNELVTNCADKIKVRDYVKSLGLESILTEIYGVYDNANEIDYSKLPKRFALKCNHGCGYNVVCTDKDKLDIEKTNKKLNKWLNTKFGYETCELHYLPIERKIYAEKFIASDKGIMPNDYKIYCFNGKAKVILVCSERDKDLKLTMFDTNWKKLDYEKEIYESKEEIEKPVKLKEMLEIAEKLSKPFKFVRVDLYQTKENKVLFGELTFTPARCANIHYNEKGAKELGKMIKL